MESNLTLCDFIERAKAAGGSEQSIIGILTARGWPEKEVYQALAVHYERLTGIEIPSREGSGTAAKDAFYYLVVFSTLATWTIGFGSLAFILIDRWLSDNLFSTSYYSGYDTYNAATSLASVLVAFPVYLWLQRTVVREGKSFPQKLNSSVRKWLTYMALVIAAGVFVGDLITVLAYFLRGEITSRFVAKAFVVLMLSGGVFYYYFGGVKKSVTSEIHGGLNRDGWMAAVSTFGVVVLAIFGFWSIGSPETQRMLRADATRVQDLYQVSGQIQTLWNSNGHKLPQHLDELTGVTFSDPVTHATYDYRAKEGSQYELCATFSLDSQDKAAQPNMWAHPSGYRCFSLNAAENTQNPYIYVPD